MGNNVDGQMYNGQQIDMGAVNNWASNLQSQIPQSYADNQRANEAAGGRRTSIPMLNRRMEGLGGVQPPEHNMTTQEYYANQRSMRDQMNSMSRSFLPETSMVEYTNPQGNTSMVRGVTPEARAAELSDYNDNRREIGLIRDRMNSMPRPGAGSMDAYNSGGVEGVQEYNRGRSNYRPSTAVNRGTPPNYDINNFTGSAMSNALRNGGGGGYGTPSMSQGGDPYGNQQGGGGGRRKGNWRR